MWAMVVVIFHPLFSQYSYLLDVFEQIGIQNISSKASIESFDVCILCGLAWLNELQADPSFFGPQAERSGNKLRPIVNPNALGLPSPFRDLIQNSNDALRWQGSIDFNSQCFSIEIIH